MANLLKETQEILEEHNLSFEDIIWIGTTEYEIPIDVFIMLADDEYNDGFGCEEVNPDIVVAGDTWWLERAEYDGSEWWEFKTKPNRPNAVKNYKVKIFDK